MFIGFRYLKTDITRNLRQGNYSPEDVIAIYSSINNSYYKRLKVFKILAIIAAALLAAFAIYTSVTTNVKNAVYNAGTLGGIAAFFFVYYWIFYMQLIRWQFKSAVKKGYPELADEIASERYTEI